jgi:hypothetical protein
MTELPRDPFGPLGSLLGYVIAIATIAMLVYTVSPAIDPAALVADRQDQTSGHLLRPALSAELTGGWQALARLYTAFKRNKIESSRRCNASVGNDT